MVAQDLGDIRFGLGPVALGVADSNQVEKWHVLEAAGLQRALCRGSSERGFPSRKVVGGYDVRNVDDHRGVLVVQAGVLIGQPAVATRGAPTLPRQVERATADEVERAAQVGDALRAARETAQP